MFFNFLVGPFYPGVPSVAVSFARGTVANLVFKFDVHGILVSLPGYVVNRVAGHSAALLGVQVTKMYWPFEGVNYLGAPY